MTTLRDMMRDTAARDFLVGAELVCTRGHIAQTDSQAALALGEKFVESDRIDWVAITDNAGGHPMMSPDFLGRRLHDKGKAVVINLTCKDLNRNALESTAWRLASEGLDNINCLTGDYPVDGYGGVAAPVFDLDSTTLIKMLHDMNAGLRVPSRKSQPRRALAKREPQRFDRVSCRPTRCPATRPSRPTVSARSGA